MTVRRGSAVCAILIAGLACVTALAQERAAAPWTLDRLMDRMAEVPSARARFTEIRHMAMMSAPLTLTGTLVYERPARIERKVLTPYQERFAVDGETLVIENRRRAETRTMELSSQPLLRAFVESIRATLAGDRATLARFYRVRLEGSQAKWTLILEPASTEMAGYVSRIRISGADNRVAAIDVEEAGGDRSLTTVTSDP